MSARPPFVWTGEHVFEINGSGLHEDTLRIEQSQPQSERMLKLSLPTLCITYADMMFQNAVGGLQLNYPASSVYGHHYFDPPVELTGESIERLTYIRGAHRVVIGPDETIIEFPSWDDLVIPRLRIDQQPGTPARIVVDSASIDVEEPLTVTVKQYADGRHVGGVALEARHPEYLGIEPEPVYDLWLRVIDALRQEPLVEAMVEIWRWDPTNAGPGGSGDFALDSRHHTDAHGVVQVGGIEAGDVCWYTVSIPGWRTPPRALRPLPQQSVRLHMRCWEMRSDTFRYRWGRDDELERLAKLTHVGSSEILRLNRLASPRHLQPGMEITFPCYQAAYRPEPWERLEQVAERFGFAGSRELTRVNGMRNSKEYDGATDLRLPEWRFFQARPGDSLVALDRVFGLPAGSAVAAHRVFRPQPAALLPGEVVAVPSQRLAEELVGRRRE